MAASKRWKQVENIFARWFGAERVPLSGGNSKISRSDSTHPRLFLEVKHHKNPAVANLFDQTAQLAAQENKIPLLGIHRKGSRRWLVVCDVEDLIKVARERMLAADYAQRAAKDEVVTETILKNKYEDVPESMYLRVSRGRVEMKKPVDNLLETPE